jgi:hypothetical protein
LFYLVGVCVFGRRAVAGGGVRAVVEFAMKFAGVKILQELEKKYV